MLSLTLFGLSAIRIYDSILYPEIKAKFGSFFLSVIGTLKALSAFSVAN